MGSVRNFPTTNAQVCLCRSSTRHGTFRAGASCGSLRISDSSAGLTRLERSGISYISHHAMSQMNPSDPVAMNAAGHPNVTVSHGTTAGDATAPTFAPALNIPVASARSRLGNHSVIALIAAGKFPDSASPRKPRATPKPVTVRTNACPIAATLQHAIAIV